MAKYIDKADIVKLINDCMFDLSDSDDLTKMLTEVDELPSVEIINCNECQHWHNNGCFRESLIVRCPDYYTGDVETNPDDFCKYGRRKEN